MKQFTLSARERMKSRKQIDRIFQAGRSFNLFPLRVLYTSEHTDEPGLKLGVTVPYRHIKKAVVRNRIKRQLRESWRTQNLALKEKAEEQKQLLQVFIVFTAKEVPDYVVIREKMMAVIEKLTQEAEPRG